MVLRSRQRSPIQVATLISPVLSLCTSHDRAGRPGVRAYPLDEWGQYAQLSSNN